MKLYKIEARTPSTDSGYTTKWAGSQTEAGKIRKEFLAEGVKKAEMTSTDVDVPTNKDGLLAFLNDLG